MSTIMETLDTQPVEAAERKLLFQLFSKNVNGRV